MSSSVNIRPKQPIQLNDWLSFCSKYYITYSSHTAGQNTFYADQVEIRFGESKLDRLPLLSSGQLDFDAASPKSEAIEICVSSYWMSNLESISRIASLILDRFDGEYTCSPELESLLIKHASSHLCPATTDPSG